MILFLSRSSQGLWSLLRGYILCPSSLKYLVVIRLPWKNCSWIANISNVTHIFYYQGYNSARSTLIYNAVFILAQFKEFLLSIRKSNPQSFFRILRETWLFDNKLMQVITKEICTSCTTMSIINAKERTSWPMLFLSIRWLQDIKDNRDPIFIVVPN